jgi:hypothetical protein
MPPRRKPSERALPSKSVDERHGFMRAIGANLPRIATPVLGKQGLGEAQLLQQWTAIVGDDLARHCWPVKLTFRRGERREGTLRLRVVSALALELQHREPVLLERINAFFGYRAVIRIALVQGAAPPGPQRPPAPRPLASTERQALDQRLDGVADERLRAALERLGSAIIGRQ